MCYSSNYRKEVELKKWDNNISSALLCSDLSLGYCEYSWQSMGEFFLFLNIPSIRLLKGIPVSLHTHTNIHIHRHILFLKCLWLYFNPIVLTYPTLFPPNIIFIECCFCNIQGSEWYLIATDCILVTNLWSLSTTFKNDLWAISQE